MAIEITTDNFEQEVKQSDVPVLVDFWAEWCAPCKMISPIVDELSTEKAGQLKVAKVNVDEQPDIASTYGIISIPTLLLFKGGQVVEQKVGAAPKAAMEKMVDAHL